VSRSRLRPESVIRSRSFGDRDGAEGDRRLSASDMPERMFMSAQPHGRTQPNAASLMTLISSSDKGSAAVSVAARRANAA